MNLELRRARNHFHRAQTANKQAKQFAAMAEHQGDKEYLRLSEEAYLKKTTALFRVLLYEHAGASWDDRKNRLIIWPNGSSGRSNALHLPFTGLRKVLDEHPDFSQSEKRILVGRISKAANRSF